MNVTRPRGGEVSLRALDAARWMLSCLDPRGIPGVSVAGRLAAGMEHRVLEPGRVLFSRGRMPEGVWVVRAGDLELAAGSGRNRVVVAVLGPCGIAGDIPLITGRPAVCTVRALTYAQTLFLAAPVFTALLAAEPEFGRAWLAGVAARQYRTQDAMAGTLGGSATGRLARLLLREARGGRVSCSQGTLAAMAGLRRPTVNQILKDFERDGLIAVGYREVRLTAADRLSRHAELSGF